MRWRPSESREGAQLGSARLGSRTAAHACTTHVRDQKTARNFKIDINSRVRNSIIQIQYSFKKLLKQALISIQFNSIQLQVTGRDFNSISIQIDGQMNGLISISIQLLLQSALKNYEEFPLYISRHLLCGRRPEKVSIQSIQFQFNFVSVNTVSIQFQFNLFLLHEVSIQFQFN